MWDVFWICGSKCGSDILKLWVDIRQSTELEKGSLLMLYPFSAAVTMKKSKDGVGKPCRKG